MHADRTPTGLAVEVADEAETDRLGQALARVVAPNTTIALDGPLGAGKTRLTRAIAEALGVDPRAVASPTFVLIHEYDGTLPIYHFDAYRLPDPDAFDALGAPDYFGAGGLCLVEWADLVADRLPPESWSIRITTPADSSRRHLALTLPDRPAEALLSLLTTVAPAPPAH